MPMMCSKHGAYPAKFDGADDCQRCVEDTKRLDWLDKQCSSGNGRTFVACLPGTLRAAIDNARLAEGNTE